MHERLTARDLRFLAVCLALLAATVWFAAANFYRAFPEASIDFRISRSDAAALAGKFLAAQGQATAGYRHASRFSFDADAKTFLERELGLDGLARFLRVYRAGTGDYTRDRHRWLEGATIQEIMAEVERRNRPAA